MGISGGFSTSHDHVMLRIRIAMPQVMSFCKEKQAAMGEATEETMVTLKEVSIGAAISIISCIQVRPTILSIVLDITFLFKCLPE